MRLRRKVAVAGVSVAALVAMLGSTAAGVPAVQAPVKVTVPDSFGDARMTVRTVTLVTGDRVTVGTRAGVDSVLRIDRADGRRHIGFAVATEYGHLHVIPSDALPLLRADRVDPRLFDVTDLLKFGYDDRRGDLPLIVTGPRTAAVPPLARSAPSTHMRNVPRGVAMHTAKASIHKLWAALATGVPRGAAKAAAGPKVWLDAIHQPTLDQSVPQIGAPTAWAAGYTGTGVTVGIVDTGIDSTHPDLVGQVVAAQDFTGGDDTRDLVGHGTHVAATVASHDSRYRGVAPGAKLLNAKVCADFGCDESAMLAGMEWAAEQGAKVINMSIGGTDDPTIDPLEAEVADLTHRFGVLFVIAAGNDGGDGTIESPGSADDALTVGAVDKSNNLAGFSSRGPRRGDEAIKPDITAPGVNIVAARSSTGVFGNPGDPHVSLSGTSMATPHVAGSAAILAQEHPDWSPAQLKEALMGSALTNPDIGVFAQGAGRVDVAHEISENVLAEPPSVSVGRIAWPHTDDTPVARTVTYHNMSNADETLALSLSTAAPAGMFTLSATSVTVPANGSASVVLTTDTNLDAPDALYDGNLVAKSTDQSVTTPFAVDKAPETHKLTVHYLDRAGQPTDDVFAVLVDPATNAFIELPADGGTAEVPPGSYILASSFFDPDTGDTAVMADPNIRVTADRDVTIDERAARPVTVTLPFRDAQEQFLVAGADIKDDGVFLAFGEAGSKVYAGSSDPTQTSPLLHGILVGQYFRPPVAGTDSPAVLQLAYHSTGRVFSGLTKHLSRDNLATVHARDASQGIATGFFRTQPVWSDWAGTLAPGGDITLPSTRVEYYNTDGGLSWFRSLLELDPQTGELVNQLLSPVQKLVGGQQYTEDRNGAAFDQGFPPPLFTTPAYARKGDVIVMTPNSLTDALGWTVFGGVGTVSRITLDRDGVRLADVTGNTGPTAVQVPPGRAGYRVGMDITRAAPNTLSTDVNTVWTFTSDTTPTTAWATLPLTALRFLPRVDLGNTAPVGAATRVGIDVDRQPGSAARALRSLAVDVSYDDGVTWTPLAVHGTLADPSVVVTAPAAGYVSLRARAVDRDGNTVDVTVIRAYHVG